MTRREWLGLVPAGAVLAATPKKMHVGCLTSNLTALKTVHDLGFDGFETAYQNVEARFAKADAARHDLHKGGLRFFGADIFLGSYDPKTSIAPWDSIVRIADGTLALGGERIILRGAPVGTAVSAKAAALNKAGQYCRSKGLRLCYQLDSPAEAHALIAATDTSWVRLMVDSADAALVEKYHERVDGVYVHDDGEEATYKPLAAAIKKTSWNGWLLVAAEITDGQPLAESPAGVARESIRRVFGV